MLDASHRTFIKSKKSQSYPGLSSRYVMHTVAVELLAPRERVGEGRHVTALYESVEKHIKLLAERLDLIASRLSAERVGDPLEESCGRALLSGLQMAHRLFRRLRTRERLRSA